MSYTGLKPSEIDLLVKKEHLAGAESYVPVGSSIFNIESPDRFNEKESVVTADGDIGAVDEGAAYPTSLAREIGTVTFKSVEYKRRYGITELMQDFSNLGSTMKLMKKAGYRARYKQDSLMAGILGGAFDSTTVWDGQYLVSASHSIGDTGLTQSNLISGALSPTTIATAHTRLMTLKDHENLTMPLQGAKLVVPAALKSAAWEYINSTDRPDTGDRAKNYVNSLGLEVVCWPLLDAISTTAWFIISEKMWHTLTCYQKVAPSMKMYKDEDTGNMWEKVRFVQCQGATDYQGIVGSTGV